ncbi:hypothetical protein B0H14DRAFT_2714893 [Mycena olivaceomarginata]|nr:hypothetical protein B0H14DRAFT_2714893 [Mycena olivaceomarginata]
MSGQHWAPTPRGWSVQRWGLCAVAAASVLISGSGADMARTCYVLLRCHGRRAGRGVLNSHCDEWRRWALGADTVGGSVQWLEGTHCGDGERADLGLGRRRLLRSG